MSQENNNRINKIAIDEEQERLDKFFEILLKADLRTIQRFKSEKENNENKTFDNA
ncbi:MAG: hypothetical protein WC437_04225 [Patescibacteria group bacterium]|jgi:hypothetical protein